MKYGRHDQNTGIGAILFCLLFACIFLTTAVSLRADEAVEEEKVVPTAVENEPEEADNKSPLARYIVVKSPIDDSMNRNVRNTALKLAERARTEDRPAYLFLELRPGQSEFYQTLALANFLRTAKVSNIRTIAWIPETVVGNNVVIALGCNEIVMHPDAELGDIGRGKAVTPVEEGQVLSMVEGKHNLQLSKDLTMGLLNPQVALVQITLEKNGTTEKRVVTDTQAKTMKDNQVTIVDYEEIKAKGRPGIFSGQEARKLGFMVSKTIQQRAELADIYGVDPQSLREVAGQGESTVVRLIDVTDTIDPILESFIQRQIERALQEGAEILIFRIESPGGYLMSGTNLANLIADLEEEEVRTIAYVPNHAISSAAITALGCDEIYMGPKGQIGDAGVIQLNTDGAFESVPEKLLSPLRNTLRSLAEQKGRPPALLEAMSFKDLQVYEVRHRDTGRIWYMTEAELEEDGADWIQGPLVPESAKGLLLTVKDSRAVELKIAAGVVENLDELKDRLNIAADVELKAVGRTWVDSLIYILNDPFVTGFLFFIAIILIYIELHFMVGIFGIGSALCFAIFFWSHYLGGTATSLEIMLFFIGIACILMEIFVIPGFGVFGVSGGLMMVLSLILASETFNNIEPEVNSQKLVQALATLGLPLIGVIISSLLIGKYLPKIPILKHIVLTPPDNRHAGDTGTTRLDPNLTHTQSGLAVGREGIALTTLRPSGKARFDNEIREVVSNGPYIQEKTPIEIVESRGSRIVVRERIG